MARHTRFLTVPLGDEEHRVDLARRVVHRDDQVERRQSLDPDVPRSVLMQHHSAHRPPGPLLAMRRALLRRLHQPGPLQAQLRHRVAQLVAVTLGQLLVEMLDREVGVFVAIEPEHPLQLLLWRPPRRRTAATIDESCFPGRLVTILPALKRAHAHSQQLRRRLLANLPGLPAVKNARKTHLPYALANPRHVHPSSSQEPRKHATSRATNSRHFMC